MKSSGIDVIVGQIVSFFKGEINTIFIAIILRLYLIRKNSEDVDNNSYPLDNSNR